MFGGLIFMSMVDFAYAMSQPPSGGGSGAVMTQLLFFAAIFAIFYFLLIRPQQKQKREREAMLTAVKKGDRVVTSSGLHGTVVGLSENTVTLKVADSVKLDFDRSAVGRILTTSGDRESGA
jgi:preprotein translocase subunit YajC